MHAHPEVDVITEEIELPVLRDVSCGRCGHVAHTVLDCGDGCDCGPQPMPGQAAQRR